MPNSTPNTSLEDLFSITNNQQLASSQQSIHKYASHDPLISTPKASLPSVSSPLATNTQPSSSTTPPIQHSDPPPGNSTNKWITFKTKSSQFFQPLTSALPHISRRGVRDVLKLVFAFIVACLVILIRPIGIHIGKYGFTVPLSTMYFPPVVTVGAMFENFWIGVFGLLLAGTYPVEWHSSQKWAFSWILHINRCGMRRCESFRRCCQ